MFIFLTNSLDTTPTSEIVKAVSFLWRNRDEINVGSHQSIGTSYQISLYRGIDNEYIFVLSGASMRTDAMGYQRVIEAIEKVKHDAS